ncbi:MAG: CotH kinase family protein [Candidatus Kapabacteria bacterium]|jgi:parallel beta-helix repeat protein|nr:CotH kinase family protein [Candidatus Kapabacteria bacterium]
MSLKNIRIMLLSLLVLFSASNIYAESLIKELYITCDQTELENIYKNYSQDIYINVSLQFQDATWTDVRMRIRGDSSRENPKKSLKMKFDAEPFSNGRDVINLNAEYTDKSYMHQYMSARLFREAGVPCFESEHARVYINGKFFGLYLMVENIGDDFLKARDLDTKGNLYKATKDGANLSIYDDIYTLWEKKTNENTDREDLQKLIDDLNSVPDDEYYAFAKSTFEYDIIVTALTMNMLIANASTYYHNYYMYHDIQGNGKWMMFPWDMDKTQSHYQKYYNFGSSGGVTYDNPMLERSIACPQMFEDIKKKAKHLSETVFNKENMFPIIDSLAIVLRASVAEETSDIIADVAEWEAQLEIEKEYIRTFYDKINNQFNKCPSQFRVKPLPEIMSGDVNLSWNRSRDPRGGTIEYIIETSRSSSMGGDYRKVYTTKDTSFVWKDLTDGIQYFWRVAAMAGSYRTDGYNATNKFLYKSGSDLPCEINQDLTLSEEDSPYRMNCNVVVSSDVTLTINPGVIIDVGGNYVLTVNGVINVNGSEDEPVEMRPVPGTDKWKGLEIIDYSLPSELNHLHINNAAVLIDGSSVQQEKPTVKFDHFKLINTAVPDHNILIRPVGAKFELTNSIIENSVSCEGIFCSGNSEPYIENCRVSGCTDAIEIAGSKKAIVRGNTIINSADDALDFNGSENVIVEFNKIYGAKDKGISVGHDGVGTSHDIVIRRNEIVYCVIAIEVKSSHDISIGNNSIFGSNIGIRLREKHAGYGGAFAQIKNNIFAGIYQDLYIVDNLSELKSSYCLSDKALFPGTGNIQQNPGFIDPYTFNFNLIPTSYCIDAGDPTSENDPDGSRADIGALAYNKLNRSVVINEINYNSPDTPDPGDWLEFYNNSEIDIDISGWVFKDENNLHEFTFPENTVLEADAYLVLCVNLNDFSTVFPDVLNIIGDMTFGLSGSGELIRLFDNNGLLIDYLTYDDVDPWVTEPDGNGPTLELINPNKDNTDHNNWKASDDNGTPGRANSRYSSVDFSAESAGSTILANYPNPFNGSTNIVISNSKAGVVSLIIYDVFGREIASAYSGFLPEGTHNIEFDGTGLTVGTYFCRFISSEGLVYVRAVVKK